LDEQAPRQEDDEEVVAAGGATDREDDGGGIAGGGTDEDENEGGDADLEAELVGRGTPSSAAGSSSRAIKYIMFSFLYFCTISFHCL
jgi:hypothetical protein